MHTLRDVSGQICFWTLGGNGVDTEMCLRVHVHFQTAVT